MKVIDIQNRFYSHNMTPSYYGAMDENTYRPIGLVRFGMVFYVIELNSKLLVMSHNIQRLTTSEISLNSLKENVL